MNHVEHMQSLYAAFGRGEIPTVMEAMHPEIEWREAEGHPYMASEEVFRGPDNVLNKLFMRLNDEWTDYVVNPISFYGDGDTVIVEGRYTGTFNDTGKEIDCPFCHIWHFEGDKVRRFQQYTHTAAYQEVMGVSSTV